MPEIGSATAGVIASNNRYAAPGWNDPQGIVVDTQSFCSACSHAFNPEAG